MLLSPEWLGDMQFCWLKRSMYDGSIEKDDDRGENPKSAQDRNLRTT